jgi:hypothetical protein
MNREFTIGSGWKIFAGVIGVALLVFSIFIFAAPIRSGQSGLVVFGISLLLIAAFILMSAFKNKIVVSDTAISCVGIFKTAEIAIADIKGIRVEQKSLIIESVTAGTKLTINNYSNYGDNKELSAWLKANFKDLDAIEYQEELTGILNDSSLGFTEEDRKQQLAKAKIIAIAYSVGGAAVMIGGFFLNSPAYIILALLYPLLGIPVIATGKGLIKLITQKKSPYYHIFIGIGFPPITLLIKGLSDGYVLQYNNFWLPATVAALVFIVAFNFASGLNNNSPVKGQIVLLLIFGALYGVGGVLQINMVFDKSTETVYQAMVLDHHISHGKSTTYHLTLSPWGPQTKQEQIDVSRYRYDNNDIGSKVSVHLKRGMLNIPWFTVSD